MGAHTPQETARIAIASKVQSKKSLGFRIAHTLLALEHRVLFDGAGAALGAEALAANSVPTNLAPDIAHPLSVSLSQISAISFDLPSGAPVTSGHAEALVLSDPDQTSGSYVLQLTTPVGRLSLDSSASLTVEGNQTGSVRVTGGLNEINQVISSLTLSGAPRLSGSSQLVAELTDPGLAKSSAVIDLDLLRVNNTPIANDDSRAFFPRSGPLTGNVVTGLASGDVADSDPDGDSFTVVGVSNNGGLTPLGGVGANIQGAYGILVLSENGSYVYTPGPAAFTIAVNTNLYETFSYTICDSGGAIDSANLSITLCGPSSAVANRPPLAVADERCISEGAAILDGQALRGNALGDHADTDADGDNLIVQALGAGLINVNGSGLLANNVGQSVLGQYGSLILQIDGTYTYRSDSRSTVLRAGQTVQDTFTYAIVDPSGASSVATITICVLGLDGGLIANPDWRSLREPEFTTGTLQVVLCGDVVRGGQPSEQADIDQDGDPIQVQGVIAGVNNSVLNSIVNGQLQGTILGSYGTLVLSADGTYCYTPDARAQCLGPGDDVGDIFSYTINDGRGHTSTTTLTINFIGENRAPVANPDQNSIVANAIVPTTGNVVIGAGKPGGSAGDLADTDPDACDVIQVCATATAQGLAGTVVVDQVGQNIFGTYGVLVMQADGSYVYTVNAAHGTVRALGPNATLVDTFTYTVCDPYGAKSTTTLDIRILGVNDLPTAPVEVRVINAGAKPGSPECLIQGIPAPTDPDRPDQVLTITVTSLPSSGNGTFLLPDGSPVKVGDILSTSQLQNLCFVPADNPVAA